MCFQQYLLDGVLLTALQRVNRCNITMVFIYLLVTVAVVVGYSIISNKAKDIDKILIYIGIVTFVFGGVSFAAFGSGNIVDILLLKEFDFSTRLVFISYGCLVSGLILYIVNLSKQ